MTLQLDSLSLRHPGQPPLFAPLSLTVPPGVVATVMGPSGGANPPCWMPSAGI
jgi:putative thiamine transport system ATP-binding protein